MYKKTAAIILTAVMVCSLQFSAFADYLLAPGVVLGSGGTSVSSESPSSASSGSESSGNESSGSSYTVINGGKPSGSGSSGTGSVIINNQSSGGSQATTAGLGRAENTDLSSSASNATVDPIFGDTPFLHVQLLMPSGNLTDGFTTMEGAFSSPEDGFSGLKLRLEQSIGDIYYRVYTEEHGWSKWAMNEMITPYSGDGAKVTAVQIRGNGHTRNLYDIYYRIVLNDGSVTGWGHDGESVGTIGTGLYAQQLQVAFWTHGTEFNQSTDRRLVAAYDEGVKFDNSGRAYYQTWNNEPYTGWGYDTAGNKYYFVNSAIVTGWQYIDGYKYYFDSDGIVVTDLEPIIGIQSDYQIKINKSMKTMTIYAKDGDNGYIMPVKVILNTIGPDTPIGTFKTYEKYRWKFMHDDIYCQYLLRFKSGFLLHSIIYQPEPDSYSLTASTYNYLGKNQSDGCVRMTSGDAYWVYTYCGVGTTVTIYEDEWVVGPFDRPAIQKGIPFDQNYDPTDPVVIANQAADAAAAAEAMQEALTGVEAPPTEIDQEG